MPFLQGRMAMPGPFAALEALLLVAVGLWFLHLQAKPTTSEPPRQAIPKLTHFRISAENPVRDLGGQLDWPRCAMLHNAIVADGWYATGRNLSQLSLDSYWDVYSNDPAWTGTIVDIGLANFLKSAMGRYNEPPEPGQHHSFHYIVSGLNPPNMLFDQLVSFGEDDPYRFVNLYRLSWAMNFDIDVGITYDQRTRRACFHRDIMDAFSTMDGQVEWQPLEVILDAYLDMILKRKIVAISQQHYESMQHADWEEPWIMAPYTLDDMGATLATFEQLVNAIERRMPLDRVSGRLEWGFLGPNEPCQSLSDLRPGQFARHFFCAARRPKFDFIAPGLVMADVSQQLHKFMHPHSDDRRITPQVQLFRSADNVAQQGSLKDEPSLARNLTLPPPGTYGLYLLESDFSGSYPFEDGAQLVLPFDIGQNGYARRSDGSYLNPEMAPCGDGPPQGSNDQLFQQGYNAITESHPTQLRYILLRWLELVESGHWEVDEHGVAGGIEKWLDADTEEHWQKYQLPVHW